MREKWQNRLRYILVDEYQDTNACQYKLLKLLTGVRAMFTAVGTTISDLWLAWCRHRNLRGLPRDFRISKVIKLSRTTARRYAS